MREYQHKKIILPRNIWSQCIWLVRDYDRLKDEYEDAIQDSPKPPDGQPRARNISNPTEREAIRRAQMSIRIRAIENALYCIPEEYRVGVWNNITKFEQYPDDAGVRTYKRYKADFLIEVAQNLYYT